MIRSGSVVRGQKNMILGLDFIELIIKNRNDLT